MSYRIPNGTNVTIGDWVGYVVEQSGDRVFVTVPGGIGTVERSQIVKQGRKWVVV